MAAPRASKRPRRRGLASQKERRAGEDLVRRSTLGCARWMARRGLCESEVARELGVARTTLSQWRDARGRVGRRHPRARGRQPEHASKDQRQAILTMLSREGTGVPIAWLSEQAPGVARRELEELRARVAYACRRRRWASFCELTWTRVGPARHSPRPHSPPSVDDGMRPMLYWCCDVESVPLMGLVPLESEHGPSLFLSEMQKAYQQAWRATTPSVEAELTV